MVPGAPGRQARGHDLPDRPRGFRMIAARGLTKTYAQKKAAFVDRSRHLVIRSPHPSPLSAHNGFFGSKPFSKANDFLVASGREPIEWALPADPEA